MLRNVWLSLFILCLSSCNSAPKVTVCISDPSRGGFDCYDEKTEKSYFLLYKESDKYVAMSPSDSEKLLDYCSSKVVLEDEIKQ